jgi:hypothetical protein
MKQEDLIVKYCKDAESTLATANDYESAVRLKESMCQQFQTECRSSLVIAAVKIHLDDLLRKRWGREANVQHP